MAIGLDLINVKKVRLGSGLGKGESKGWITVFAPVRLALSLPAKSTKVNLHCLISFEYMIGVVGSDKGMDTIR